MKTPITSRVLLAALTGLLAGCGATLTPDTHLDPSGVQATVTRHPILFVHGYNSSASTWDTMVANFKKDGYTDAELHRFTYDTRVSNTTTADIVRQKVDEVRALTGAARVDIIAHSMGSLSSRYYIKHLGGDGKIDAWVSLGGPNHGTDTANYCFDTSCREMRIGSTWLANLNAGDETPGLNTRFGTFWSPCDEVINPDSSVSLSGATNTKTACVTHGGLLKDSRVYTAVRDFVNR